MKPCNDDLCGNTMLTDKEAPDAQNRRDRRNDRVRRCVCALSGSASGFHVPLWSALVPQQTGPGIKRPSPT